jgi:hypothetical protein
MRPPIPELISMLITRLQDAGVISHLSQRSGFEELPHPAPDSGNKEQALLYRDWPPPVPLEINGIILRRSKRWLLGGPVMGLYRIK